jgi:hypothetical protein
MVFTMKKFLSMLLVGAVLAGGVIGCSEDKEKEKKKTTETKKTETEKKTP